MLPFPRRTADSSGLPAEALDAPLDAIRTDRPRWLTMQSQPFFATHLGNRVSPAPIDWVIRTCLDASAYQPPEPAQHRHPGFHQGVTPRGTRAAVPEIGARKSARRCGNLSPAAGVDRPTAHTSGIWERSIDDAEAVARSVSGDLDAYAVLVARYTARAHRAAYLLGAREEADDVVQDAFVKAFRHLGRFRTGEPFAPWLLRIVANETKNLTRSRGRRAALTVKASASEPREAAGEGPLDGVLAAERRAELLRAVDALPERQRRAVTCRYFLDLSEAETALVLGWPVGSVKSRTARALRRLRGLLGAEYGEEVARG